VKRKSETVEDDSLPDPWRDADEVVTRSAWAKHRDLLMRSAAPGTRPEGWWLYEHGKPPPEDENTTIYLWRIGELKAGERAQVETWWRMHYDDAGTMADRTTYWRWHDIPLELIERWDRDEVVR
jgi:hypothetical protein